MRVLISGGGLAGLTLAYWLEHYGMTPVVIERAPALRRSGYGIDFFGTGYDVGSRMGIIDRLRDQQLPIEHIRYLNKHGKPDFSLDIALLKTAMDNRHIGVMHWSVEEALYDITAPKVEIRFGTSIISIEQDQGAVYVEFEDGRQESFDLLIGADGLRSHTRALCFGADDQFSRYLGYSLASFTLPDRYNAGETWDFFIEPKRQVSLYPTGKRGEVAALYIWESEAWAYVPRDERLPRLRQRFDDMGWLASRLLDDLATPDSIYMDAVTQIRMPTWSRGRTALLGDAAYCLTLVSGQGASMAMGGAYVLAAALRDHADHRQAFQVYESQLRPSVESRQNGACSIAKSFVPGNWLEWWMQRLQMRIFMRQAFVGLLRRQFGSQSIVPPAPADARH